MRVGKCWTNRPNAGWKAGSLPPDSLTPADRICAVRSLPALYLLHACNKIGAIARLNALNEASKCSMKPGARFLRKQLTSGLGHFYIALQQVNSFFQPLRNLSLQPNHLKNRYGRHRGSRRRWLWIGIWRGAQHWPARTGPRGKPRRCNTGTGRPFDGQRGRSTAS